MTTLHLAALALVLQTPEAKAAVRAATVSAPALKPPAALPKGEKVASVRLEPDARALTPEANRANLLMSYPASILLSEKRPDRIKKEPAYAGKPRYGTLPLGTGANAPLDVVFDETPAEARVYIDVDRDGDLADDPPFRWDSVSDGGDGRVALSGLFVLPAVGENGAAPYGLTFLRTKGTDRLTVVRSTARKGKLMIGGKTYDVRLADNTSDAVYDNLAAAKARRPFVWLMIDFDGDGTFRPTAAGREVHDTTRPIPIGDGWYAAEFTKDGAELTLFRTEAPPKVAEAPRNPLLKPGTKAPDFKFVLAGGRPASLSDHRGKLRIVDMWATWCGPCLAALPKIEALHRQVKDQGVVVIGLNVMDEREAYEKWIAANAGKKYHITFGTDASSAGREAGGIAAAWGVYAIPTTFLIDRDDTVLLVLTGLGPENHKKLVETLDAKGVKVDLGPEESEAGK